MTADTTAQTKTSSPQVAQPERLEVPEKVGRIGLFGGTFDPPHLGHLIVGEQVRSACGLDEVWFVVANDPWQKAERTVTSAALRLAMTIAAIGGAPGLVASDVEVGLGGPSYTVDTLAELRRRHPDVQWSVIVGSDAAAGLETWERADELAATADFLVVERPGERSDVPDAFRWRAVPAPLIDISSSEVRRRVADGESIRFLVPDAVLALIEAEGIYRRPE